MNHPSPPSLSVCSLTTIHISGGAIGPYPEYDYASLADPFVIRPECDVRKGEDGELHGPPWGICLLFTIPSLTHLEFSYVQHISPPAVAALAACPHLR